MLFGMRLGGGRYFEFGTGWFGARFLRDVNEET